MPGSDETKRSFLCMFPLKLKIALVSFLSLVVTAACSRLRLRGVEQPDVLCYTVISPTDTPTPVVMCYEVSLPTDTPTPVCYTATPSPSASHTPTPTLTLTPLCYTATLTPTPLGYTPTPSPTAISADDSPFLPPDKVPPVTCYAPQADVGPAALGPVDVASPVPTPSEARHLLLEKLLAQGRFPLHVARRLKE
jgi:hypothetical protein